jgi:DNA-binding transcriptional MerR regulator
VVVIDQGGARTVDDVALPEEWTDADGTEWITLTAVARLVGRTAQSVVRWEREGLIPPAPGRMKTTKKRLYRRTDLPGILEVARRLSHGKLEIDDHDGADDEYASAPLNADDDRWRPTPWSEVEGNTDPVAANVKLQNSTDRYLAEVDRSWGLIRSENYHSVSGYRGAPRRGDSWLHER